MLHEHLKNRRSPRAFSEKPVPVETLITLLEAARWSPSRSNEQPWNFFVAPSPNHPDHARIVSCLVESNAVWAKHAPVLLLSVARLNSANGAPNGHAMYDLGQAVAHLTFQATASELFVHQMAGFDVKKAREVFSIPTDHEPASVAAIGYLGDVSRLSEKLQAREIAPRTRKPLTDFIFQEKWGEPADWITKNESI